MSYPVFALYTSSSSAPITRNVLKTSLSRGSLSFIKKLIVSRGLATRDY